MDVNIYRVNPGSRVDLQKWDPEDKRLFDAHKEKGREALPALNKQLEALQELLWAEEKHKVLIVLQLSLIHI